MKTVTIKTKNWCRGSLNNQYGHHCAIGFLEQQYPDYSYNNFSAIVRANDNLRGQERRKELVRLFKEEGYRLVFK